MPHPQQFHAREPHDPDDRRHTERRDEDVERAVAVETQTAREAWAALMLIKRGPLLAYATMIASAITFMLTTLGFRYVGPAQDIKALDAKFSRADSLMDVRMIRVEDGIGRGGNDVRELRESVRFLTYVVCIQVRRQDPAASPPGCDPIIQSKPGGAP